MEKNRVMRAIVFFDLPNIYAKDKRNYLRFRKFLLNEGFLMMQESVYSKIVLNSQQANFLNNRIKKSAPNKGIIQMLTITEKQYSQIEYIIGSSTNKIINESNLDAIESEEGVEVVRRSLNNEDYYFVMNHTSDEKKFRNKIVKA